MLETPQQASPTDKVIADSTRGQSAGNMNDLCWLCGFIDGEGCIYLRRRTPWKKQKHLTFQPEVVIINTNRPTLERVSQILSSYGVGSYISKPNPTNLRRHPNWKPACRIVIAGMKRTEKILRLCVSFLFTKQKQAKLVLDFIELRKTKDTRDMYGSEEFDLVEKLHVLNQRGSSETLRAPQYYSDDKVQA